MKKEPKLRTNFTYNLGYQLLAIVLPLITAPYVSRVLGSHNVGVYSYTQACANYFSYLQCSVSAIMETEWLRLLGMTKKN